MVKHNFSRSEKLSNHLPKSKTIRTTDPKFWKISLYITNSFVREPCFNFLTSLCRANQTIIRDISTNAEDNFMILRSTMSCTKSPTIHEIERKKRRQQYIKLWLTTNKGIQTDESSITSCEGAKGQRLYSQCLQNTNKLPVILPT